MTHVTIIGGSLGAGKTTLLLNLINSGSFTDRNGIIVMDAAGDIDYSRVYNAAARHGTPIANATSACTVCDGPESVFKRLQTMANLDSVIVELSGQMPLSVMRNRLTEKGVLNQQALYLVDPQNFQIVQGPDEVPFADVVGVTKRDTAIDFSQYNPTVKVVRIRKDATFTLAELTEGVENLPIGPVPKRKHCHPKEKGYVSKWAHKVHNPYHSEEELRKILKPLAQRYDRIKGNVALDATTVFSFDGVLGDFSYSLVQNPSLGNGVILLASQGDNFFPAAGAQRDTAQLTKKPNIPPVLRRGSPVKVFEMYIGRALEAKEYDAALGAGEQYLFETGNPSLLLATLPAFAQGKLELIDTGELSRSQSVLQGMSALYYLLEHPDVAPKELGILADNFRRDYRNMTGDDWEEVKTTSSSDAADYVHAVARSLQAV